VSVWRSKPRFREKNVALLSHLSIVQAVTSSSDQRGAKDYRRRFIELASKIVQEAM
jgi:hypothetical protein